MPNDLNKVITRLDDISSFLGLVSIILSIQSSLASRQETEQCQQFSDRVIIVSVFIAACSSFIDLSTAKLTYDQLINSKKKVSKKQIKAGEDLLLSRIFSVLAVIYLIKATLESTGDITTASTSAVSAI